MKRSARDLEESLFELNEDVLRRLRLRRIVKENHGGAITGLATCSAFPNLVATTGDVQASVYDNEHHGDHLDLVSHYPGVKTTALAGCCWLHADRDAHWAVGGADGSIQIVSLALSKVVAQIKGHPTAVLAVLSHAAHGDVVFSLSSSQFAAHRVSTGALLLTHEVRGASSVALDASGRRVLLGTAQGGFLLGDLAADSTALAATRTLGKRPHFGALIDCVAFVGERDVAIAKAVNGRVEVWDLADDRSLAKWAIKSAGGNNHCRFDLSPAADYLVVGDGTGGVVVYSVASGKEVVDLRHKRSRAAITHCAFTRSGRSVLFSSADSTLWRYDYVDQATLAEWAKLKPAAE